MASAMVVTEDEALKDLAKLDSTDIYLLDGQELVECSPFNKSAS